MTFGVVAALQLGDDRFDVRLPGARDEKLVGLRIAEEPDHRVVFHQLVQRRRELVLIGAGLRLDGVGHGGFGHGYRLEEDLVRFVAERVSGQRDAQLGDGAEVAGVEFLHLDRLAALHDGEVRQALGLLPREVLHRGVGLHCR